MLSDSRSPSLEQKELLAHITYLPVISLQNYLKNLTLLATVRAHRRKIRHTLNSRMELCLSKFLSNHDNGVCLVAYEAKSTKSPICCGVQRIKMVRLLMTNTKAFHDFVYNLRKDGIDMFHKNLEEFLCRRKTIRRALLLLCKMLDAAANNSYIMKKKAGRYSESKNIFENLRFLTGKTCC